MGEEVNMGWGHVKVLLVSEGESYLCKLIFVVSLLIF